MNYDTPKVEALRTPQFLKPLRYLKSRIPDLGKEPDDATLAEHWRCTTLYRMARRLADRGAGDKVQLLARLEYANGAR